MEAGTRTLVDGFRSKAVNDLFRESPTRASPSVLP